MADELATFAFPGIEAVESADYTRSHGRTPGVCTIKCRPQRAEPSPRGTLQILYGSSYLLIPDCIISEGEITRDGSGQVVQVRILDRRWKWQFPTISGRYNRYDENGNLDINTDKAPQELAKLCLEAMGEVSFSVTAMPNDTRPFVDWDYSNAAEALESLAEACGCRIVLGINDRVRIEKVGEGASLPLDNAVERHTDVADLAEAPDYISYVSAPYKLQWDMELEAVGYDVVGERIKPLDELSYKPAAGWDAADLDFENSIEDPKLRELAIASVFRLYRIKRPEDGAEIPGADGGGLDTLTSLERLSQLELLDSQVETEFVNGIEVPKAPCVYGIWNNGKDNSEDNWTEDLRPLGTANEGDNFDYDKIVTYPYGFSLNTKDCTIHFGTPVYKTEIDGDVIKHVPAELRLRIGYRVRDKKTNAYLRFADFFNANGATGFSNGTRHLMIVDNEMAVTSYPQFKGDFNNFGLGGNFEDFIEMTNSVLQAEKRKYVRANAQTVTYSGLRFNPDLDGAIQQITWTVPGGNAHATTTIYRNNDYSDVLPSYAQMRYRRRLQGGLETLKRLAGAVGDAAGTIGRTIFGGSR
jgi:hypothetical protein